MHGTPFVKKIVGLSRTQISLFLTQIRTFYLGYICEIAYFGTK